MTFRNKNSNGVGYTPITSTMDGELTVHEDELGQQQHQQQQQQQPRRRQQQQHQLRQEQPEDEEEEIEQQHQSSLPRYSSSSSSSSSSSKKTISSGLAFWLLGLLNNSSYVIMLASAKEIIEGGTALVFLANALPSLLLKLSVPYWFDRVSYRIRLFVATGCMICSFVLVATFSASAASPKHQQEPHQDDMNSNDVTTGVADTTAFLLQFLGVALGSIQCGLGEASLLAAAGRCDGIKQEEEEEQQQQVSSVEREELLQHEGLLTSIPTTTTTTSTTGAAAAEAAAAEAAAAETTATTNTTRTSDNSNNEPLTVTVTDHTQNLTSTNSSNGVCLACFSSGTGLAGVFGFFWKFVWIDFFGFSLPDMLYFALLLAALYLGIYVHCLGDLDNNISHTNEDSNDNHNNNHEITNSYINRSYNNYRDVENHNGNNHGHDHDHNDDDFMDNVIDDNHHDSLIITERDTLTTKTATSFPTNLTTLQQEEDNYNGINDAEYNEMLVPVHDMTIVQRFRLVLSLWKYIIPLFLVYAAEYSLQAGTWTAIGFPVSSEEARDEFYEYSNWMYQVGVFLSRSSGTLFTAPMSVLWLMPILQVVNVFFFAMVASQHIWYNYVYLIPCCLFVGLLGGAVYAHGYKRICKDFGQMDRREFALATTSVAEGIGIVTADFIGLYIQSCLYQINRIPDAFVTCPIRNLKQ